MTKDEYIRTIPNRNAEEKIYRGIYYSKGKMSASTGPFYVSIKSNHTKASEGKIYSTDGNLIETDIKTKVEMDFIVEQYISNKRSYTVGVDELKHLLKKTNVTHVIFDGFCFKREMLMELLEASNYLDIQAFNLTSVKDRGALLGISLIEHSIVLGACCIITDSKGLVIKDFKELLKTYEA